MPTGVAVEKLLSVKFAKIKSRQDALQTTFSVFLDIFYPPNFRCFEENGLFQQPQAITLRTPQERVGECNGDLSTVGVRLGVRGEEPQLFRWNNCHCWRGEGLSKEIC